MKITKKCLAGFAALVLAGGAALAQADDFGFGDFGAAAAESGEGFGDFGDFGGTSSGASSADTALTVNGTVEANARAYVRKGSLETDSENPDSTVYADSLDDLQKFPVESDPKLTLKLGYSGANSDFSGKLKFSKTVLEDYNQDILEEFTARLYLGAWQLEAGKMKIVWGKGDKIHVLDNFNANDYTDYIIPDYIDRRIAEPAFRAVYTTNSGVKVEGVYTPMMTADRLASSGVWKPAALTSLETGVTSRVKSYLTGTLDSSYAPTAATVTALTAASSLSADSLYPDTQKLKYGQAGLRTTFTLGSVDLGLSYYYGHYKQPTVNQLQLSKYVADYMANGGSSSLATGIDYDQLQVFGIEGATILLGRLNSRFELAYNLTKDFAGDDPWVKNNSIGWVAGFDVDLPINEVNFNIQTQGSYILHNDKIDDDDGLSAAYKAAGVHGAEYDEDGIYTNNKIIVDITDSYNHDKVKVDVKGIYGIERKDLIVIPTLTLNPRDDFTLNFSGMAIWSADSDKSEFAGWLNNDFFEISAKYQF